MTALTPLFVNAWSTTLASSVANGAATTFALTSATGLPTPGTNQFIPAVVVDTSTSPETIKEYVYITGLSGTTATVTRAAEDAATYPAGALASGLTVAAVATKGSLGSMQYGAGIYGDGSDGAITFDGTSTVLGLVPSASTYTLTRDLFLGDGTSIANGVSINTSGWRLYCQGTLVNNGTIHFNGLNGGNGGAGTGGSAGATTASNTLGGGRPGGAGSTGNGVAGGSDTANGFGGNGGNGGKGAGSSSTGGAQAFQSFRTPPRFSVAAAAGLAVPQTSAVFSGGGGGGGGGGDSTNGGGGGASGGAVVLVCAKFITGTGAIQSRGGNGGNGNAAGNTGGGGGGGGGVVAVVSHSVISGAVAGQTIDCAHGTGGAANGTGIAGSNGTDGVVILIPN